MLERAEFHPLAGRVVSWMLSLLTPWVRSEAADVGDGVVVQRVDLVLRQCGAQVWIACTRWVENRSRAAIHLSWTVPQPPIASAHAIGGRLGGGTVRGQAYPVAEAETDARRAWHDRRPAVVLWQTGPVTSCLAAGWVPPDGSMEVTSHHLYVLEPGIECPDSTLHVQLDAALALPSRAAARSATNCAAARRPGSRGLSAPAAAGRPTLLKGVLGRLARRAGRGFVLQSTRCDRAVFRGVLAGCATRLLLGQVDHAAAGIAPPAAHGWVESLLRAYRDPCRAPLERARLARTIAQLGLEHGLVTPWTALLAARGASSPDGDTSPARALVG